MKVCLVQLTFFPEAGRVDIYEYSRALAQLGVDVHVVVCRRPRTATRSQPRITMYDVCHSTAPTVRNALRFAYNAWRIIKRQTPPFAVVHLFNPSPATFLLLILLRLTYVRSRLIYDIRTGGVDRGFRGWLINTMAKTAPLFADGVIVVSQPLRDRLFPRALPMSAIVPLGARPSPAAAARQRRGDGRFQYVYLGALNANRELHRLFSAFVMVFRRYPHARLRMIGDGNARTWLTEWVKQRALESVISFTSLLPYEHVPTALSTADCGLSFIPVTPQFHPQPPLKTFEYFAAGLPVVATATRAHQELWRDLPAPLLTSDRAGDFAHGMIYVLKHRHEFPARYWQQHAEAWTWLGITHERLIPFYRRMVSRAPHSLEEKPDHTWKFPFEGLAGRRLRKTRGGEAAPLVSVVIPAYNTARFLPATVQSALGQTYPNLEVVVVDDGSTDGTENLLVLKDPRVRYYKIPRSGGPATPRNAGVKHSRGSLIAFLDSDDIWLTQKLEKQLTFMEEGGFAFVCCDAKTIDAAGNVIQESFLSHLGDLVNAGSDAFRRLYEENFVITSSAVVNKSCLNEVGLFDPDLNGAEDYDLWLRLSESGARMGMLPRQLLLYRKHPRSHGAMNAAKNDSRVLAAVRKNLKRRRS